MREGYKRHREHGKFTCHGAFFIAMWPITIMISVGSTERTDELLNLLEEYIRWFPKFLFGRTKT